MKLYDISQEIFSCDVYPGDRGPCMIEEMRMSQGEVYNLSSFEMGAHNGTHIDAPFHFFEDGDTIDKIPLEKTVGYCYVSEQNATIGQEEAKEILSIADKAHKDSAKRILIKGTGEITLEAAQVFAEAGIYLVGVESQTVGAEQELMAVHKTLLNKKIVLLEGTRLTEVKEGVYFLSATPILLAGVDGAPCRAILIQE